MHCLVEKLISSLKMFLKKRLLREISVSEIRENYFVGLV